MKIGELAQRGGVGVETVRYYERRGLLPEPDRTDSGYREYEGSDLLRLRFILRSKALGFSLSEVRELLDLRIAPGRTADDVRHRAHQKMDDVEARIADLQRIRGALSRLIGACDAHGPPEACALMHAVGGDEEF